MTIINTTFVADKSVENDVLDWIRSTYIKSARRDDRTEYPNFVARVSEAPDPGTAVFAAHITFPDHDTARRWDEKFGSRLRLIAAQRWGEKALSFSTYLHVIE